MLSVPSADPPRLSDDAAELTILTDLGPGGRGGLRAVASDGETPSAKRWLVADWGRLRAVTGITVDVEPGPSSQLGRLRIDDRGLWYPPAPKEFIALGKAESLPHVVASRIMVEVVANDVVHSPAQAPLSALLLTFAGEPRDLALSIGDESALFERPGQLLPNEKITIEQGLAAALTARMPQDGAACEIPLVLRARLPGRIEIAAIELVAVRIFGKLNAPQQTSVALPWGEPGRGHLTIGAGSELGAVQARVELELRAEELALAIVNGASDEVDPPDLAATVRRAQLVDPRRELAQPVPALSAPLVGVDLYFIPTTAKASAELTLHPDDGGRPAQAPFGRATFVIDLEGARAGRWCHVDLDTPIRLPDGPFWAVLRALDGELLCPLVDLPAAPYPVAYRIDGGPWVPRNVGSLARPGASCRVRTVATPPEVVLVAKLRRGDVEVSLPIDAAGRVTASADLLATLNSAADAPVLEFEFHATPPPGRAVAGTVHLHELRVQCS